MIFVTNIVIFFFLLLIVFSIAGNFQSVDGDMGPCNPLFCFGSNQGTILQWKPFGGPANHLNLLESSFNNGTLEMSISGDTGSHPAGFATQKNLSINANEIEVAASDIIKNGEFLISIAVEILNPNSTYNHAVFVNGPFRMSGWTNGTHYTKINSHSTEDVVLDSSQQSNSKINRIYIIVQKNSTIDHAEFSVKFLA